MPIRMNCPSCGKALSAPDASSGKKAKCPDCGQLMVVPEAVHEAESVETAGAGPAAGAAPASGGAMPAMGEPDRRPCPVCGEMIVAGAAKCRFCNAVFDPMLKSAQGRGSGKGNEFLRQVASYQRGLIFSILAQIVGYVLLIMTSASHQPALALVPFLLLLAGGVAGLVFTILVATRVYSTGTAIVLGILLFIPCVGLIVLLVVNQAATKTLTDGGIQVGFFGASISQF